MFLFAPWMSGPGWREVLAMALDSFACEVVHMGRVLPVLVVAARSVESAKRLAHCGPMPNTADEQKSAQDEDAQ
eukprot:4621867-Pyramimonas_sp.AAC.1